MSHINYYLIVPQKGSENILKRTGRPKVENPKTIEVKARIDEETNKKLINYCEKNNTNKTEVVRKGINLVLEKTKKE